MINKKKIDNLNNDSIPMNTDISSDETNTDLANKVANPSPIAVDPALLTKYPTRTLDELRKRDYVQNFEAKLPEIIRPGFVVSWICNTPHKNYIDMAYSLGYDFIPDVEPVNSGYATEKGELMHYAMQIPTEVFVANKKAEQEKTDKMYGHILKAKSKGNEDTFRGDGMYDPHGRKVETVHKIVNVKND